MALVLLNFLIALISGTYDKVASDRELYDVKELLPLIRDFDLFLKRSKPSTSSSDVRAKHGSKKNSFFVILVEETELSSEAQELKSAIEGGVQTSAGVIKSELASLRVWSGTQLDQLRAGFTGELTRIEGKTSTLEAKMDSLSANQAKILDLLTELTAKSAAK